MDCRACQRVEERGLTRIGVSHKGNNREWNPLAGIPMQTTCAPNLLQLFFDPADPVREHSLICFDLRFARSTKEAEATALTLKMGPQTYKTRALIFEMGQFDLQHTLSGGGTGAENIKDQTRPIHDLAPQRLFQIALLPRRQAGIDNDDINLIQLHGFSKLFNLPATQQRCRATRPKQNCRLPNDHQSDGGCKTDRFFQTGICSPDIFLLSRFLPRENDSSTRGRLLGIKSAQSSLSANRGRAPTGMIVLMACL